MTKNRLAMTKDHFAPASKDNTTVRSHTVNTTARKKIIQSKNFNSSQRDYLSNSVARVDTKSNSRTNEKQQLTQKSQESLKNKTWTSSF